MKTVGKLKQVIEVQYHEIEALAKEHYGAEDYKFAAVEECCNDSFHSFEVSDYIESYDNDAVALIRQGKVPMYRNDVLLNMLCKDGHINAGEYLVNVCW